MGEVNVNKKVDDQFYRYKMPKLIAKVEGKGNGIKTVIVNMPDIAKALSRPPMYPTKYFGCELGAQTQFDKNERYIVNGAHDSAKLQELLHNFIKKFVLCPECENPETNLIVKKQMISQSCIACGYHGSVDIRHKLTTYILKNPPSSETSSTPNKKDKKTKRKQKDQEKDAEQETQQESSPPPVSNVSNNHHQENNDEDDDDWGHIDETEVKAQMQELSSAVQKLAVDDDLEKSAEERLEIFYNFVDDFVKKGNIANEYKALVNKAELLEVKDKSTMVLVEKLLTLNVLQQSKDYKKIFIVFCHDNQKAQKYLLHGLEQLIDAHKDILIPKVPHILKAFYDEDIIEEEVFFEWEKKVSKRYVPKNVSQEIRDKAKPFLTWLKEAEVDSSEEEEDDEEEDDIEVVYSHDAKQVQTKTIKSAPAPATAPAKRQEEDDEDDLDIDDI